MASVAKKVQLVDPEQNEVLWYPITTAESVLMDTGGELLINEIAKYMKLSDFTIVSGGVRQIKESVIPELSKYLKQGSYSETTHPYVQEVSVINNNTALRIKTYAKEQDGVLKEETVPIVGENTKYSLSSINNTEVDPNENPNSAIRLTGTDGSSTDVTVPVGTLRDDNNVILVLNGNFYPAPSSL